MGMSTSAVHHDFTIGGPEVDVSGVLKNGREEPLIVGGSWHSSLESDGVTRGGGGSAAK